MEFCYKCLEWSSDPRFRAEPSTRTQQSLDDLINERSRVGWELYGVYAESLDGSKYRLLFKAPCPEREARKLLAHCAPETELSFQQARKQAAKELLKDLFDLNGVLGLTVEKSEGKEDVLTVDLVGKKEGVAVKINDAGNLVLRKSSGSDKGVPLWFNSLDGVLEPEEKEGLVPQTALGVFVNQILNEMK